MNQQHDIDIKRIIITAIVVISVGLISAVIALSLTGQPIPPELDRLATAAFGFLSGMLIKTGVDKPLAGGDAIPVVNAPGAALKTEDVREDGEAPPREENL